MRKSVLSIVAIVMLGTAVSVAGVAASQVAPPATSPTAAAPAMEATPPTEAAPTELSEEDKTATPFPPGRYAAVVKRVCVDCHNAKPIIDLRYTREEAEALYKNMVSTDLETDQAKQILEYLTTTLAP